MREKDRENEREGEGGRREGGRERESRGACEAQHARAHMARFKPRAGRRDPQRARRGVVAVPPSKSPNFFSPTQSRNPSPLHAPGRPAAAWTSLVSACAFCRAHHPAGTAPPAGFSEAAQQREAPLRLPAQPKFNEDGHALAITTTLSLETPAQVGALNLPGEIGRAHV